MNRNDSPHVRVSSWRNHLVYIFAGWVHWIFAGFFILYASFWGREGSHWIGSTLKIQMAWFSARFVTYGSSMVQFRPIFIIVDFFRKVVVASWHGIYRVFEPSPSKFTFSRFSVGTKQMRDEKLRRFVVVSPREVPYSTFWCPFKIFNFWSFLKVPRLSLSQIRKCSVH